MSPGGPSFRGLIAKGWGALFRDKPPHERRAYNSLWHYIL